MSMEKSFWSVICAVAFASLSASAANVWHVNNKAPNASDTNPGTEAEPFLTINAATTNALFEAGDTVLVHPGVYNSGTAQSGNLIPSRVLIPQKTILHATGCPDETIIEGVRGTGGYGMGEDAVRCIALLQDAAESEIKGFTVRNGGTRNQDNKATGCGGGIYVDTIDNIFVVDCVISNCAALKGGGMYNGTAVRCYFLNNNARCSNSSSSGNCGAAANEAFLFNCVIDSCSGSRNGEKNAAISECVSVNCTVCNCKSGISTKQAYNCVFTGMSEKDVTNNGTLSRCTTTAANGFYQLIGPGVGDYRLIAGIGAEELGCLATEVATRLKLPSKYCDVDFAGNPFPQSGSCLPGAVQKIAQAKGGAIQAKGGNLLVEGKVLRTGGYIFPEAWPTQFHIAAEVPAGKHLWAFNRNAANGGRIFPHLDDTAFIMPSPDVTNVTTTEPVFASTVYYVNPDPEKGSDSNSGTTAATPFLTLQKAMDNSSGSEYTVIRAAEGDYNQGGKTINSSQGNNWTLTNRVCAAQGGYYVRIIGAGIGKSFISGAPDPNTGGNGPCAIRPIGIFCHDAAIQGFTIRNGFVDSTSTLGANHCSAAMGRNVDWSADGNMLTIADCLITDCTAHGTGSLAQYVCFSRCRIVGNNGGSILLPYQCKSVSCLIADNSVSETLLGSRKAANCTVRAMPGSGVASASAYVYASILEGGKTLASGSHLYGSLVWDLDAGSLSDACDYTFGCPCFIDPANGDRGVYSVSSALEAGSAPASVNWGGEWWKLAATGDIDGNRIAINDSYPVAGCVSKVSGFRGAYVVAPNGGLSVETGAVLLEGGETATVSMGAGTRPAIGFTANGVTNLFDTATSMTVTANDSLLIEPIYTTDWYVDAEYGSDGNLGFTPKTAKKTFKALLENCNVISGDTLHAAEGVYDDGEMIAAGETVASRIIVPAGVTVAASGRPENTIVKGGAATVDPDSYGLGTNAVRCVSLNNGSKITGFTLTGGRTGRHGNQKEHPENMGGAVFGIGANVKVGVVENCIISNNAAYRGGGAAFTAVVKCKVCANRGVNSEGGGSGAYKCSVYGSVFAKNNGSYCLMYSAPIVNCTVADDNNTNQTVYNTEGCTMQNCIFNCVVRMKSQNSLALNSFFSKEPVSDKADIIGEGSEVVGADSLKLDPVTYRPVIGQNVAIDAGNVDYHKADICGNTDLSGLPRISNGAIDAGALEADWRGEYAAALSGGNNGFTVEAASVNVRMEAGSPVKINPGQSFKACWQGKAGRTARYGIAFRVTGNGTLTITADGNVQIFTSADGDVDLCFTSSAAEFRIDLDYAGGENDEGCVEILATTRQIGLWMIIR